MKILTVVGARPQFIKAAQVSRALRALPAVSEVLVHTGQHYDENMSDVFFDELEMPQPAINLGVGSGSHGDQTARMLAAIERTIVETAPQCVLVYGDTNSTLAGALAAVKLGVPVAHVEAGLRSFNRAMPEEINRVLTDHACDRLFAPTATAVRNLKREGIAGDKVLRTGDVMYDAALYFGRKAKATSRILDAIGLEGGRFVLATIHRAENTNAPLRLAAIVEALARLAREIPVVVPLHPRTRAALGREVDAAAASLRIIDPVGYFDMVMLEQSAALVATDSGGVQKEAYFYRVPCVTLRTETEWVELVDAGWNRLAPPFDAETVYATLRDTLSSWQRPRAARHLYGRGDAAAHIAEALVEWRT